MAAPVSGASAARRALLFPLLEAARLAGAELAALGELPSRRFA